MKFTLGLPFFCMVLLSLHACDSKYRQEKKQISDEMENSIKTELLNRWYPKVVDQQYGGYLTTFTHDFQPTGLQDKMIVSQARHLWTSSKASAEYPDIADFKAIAKHGFQFLQEVMWDKDYGGFFTIVDRQGNVKGQEGEMKTAYGNAFGIYGLAAYYKTSGDSGALKLAQEAFLWLEKNSHDPVHKGYFQHLQRDGKVIQRDTTLASTSEVGYKDQNSSIHLLEAFMELYQVWPDPLVGERLKEMLYLIRDTITTGKGYLVLFFQPDWTPVSFSDSSKEVILRHHNLDHVSFGHDVETAYLMLEASHIAGIKDDTITLRMAKRMVDHALKNGWDNTLGGFYDEGYYFKNDSNISIIKDTKNWWAQAEGLNTLQLMADYFPDDPQDYFEKFKKLWTYTSEYIIDHEHGEWYQGGLDKQPDQKTALKGHIWKASYHQFRGLANCVERLQQHNTPH